MSSTGISGLDSSTLLSFYQAQLQASPSAIAAASAVNAQTNSSAPKGATANDVLPWTQAQPAVTAQQAKVLNTTNFLDTTNVPLTSGATSDGKLEQDNQKLFSLYNAISSLQTLTQMAQSSTTTDGQRAGLNTRFQAGLAQVQQYLSSSTFNNYTLQAATPAASVTATAQVAVSDDTYQTKQLITNANLNNPVPGLSASDSFNIAVKKNGVTTNVNIDLSQVQGGLTLGNVVSYINSQLAAGGFSTRFQKVETGGTATSDANATYSLQITPGGAETISLSAASTPSLYLAGNTGVATETSTVTNTETNATDTTPADQAGRLAKLSNLSSSSPTGTFSVSQDASTGTTTAQATAVDSSGNVYVIGNATGNLGNQLNQGTQDTYLTKYDSAGNVVWQQLLGSSGSASAYGLALDPATGGIIVSGTSTAALTDTSVANGNNDSFVASYDSSGNQTWVQQVQTLATNQANAVSVDASGNIYIGGSVSGGVIGSGQTSQGGGDAFLVKLNSSGKVLAENQFGTSGADSVAATATGSDGSLYVASVQNGEGIVSKYANGDITSAPTWSMDMGTLGAGGNIGGLTVSNGQVYVSGSTSDTNLTAGGQASIATASSGGTDAFVFNLSDNGTSATANHVSYIGTSGTDQGGAVTVGSDGTVYLAGTTTGTFAGQSRNIQNVTNAFATAINADGSVQWTKQLGGADGQSTGSGIAIDPNGSSVLDALGLPRGTISPNQTVDLAANTTLRAGDSFQIQIEGTAARTATITIDQGETLDSLVTKINAQLGQTGTAKINYGNNTEALQITVNSGKTINLVAGPSGFDALSRLGITPGVLSAPKSGSTSTTTSTSTSGSSSSTTLPTYGLGLTATALGPLDISSTTGADLTRSTLLTVLSNIQSTYQKSNTPPPSTTTPAGNTTGTASAATTSQLANYSLALSLLNNDPSNAVVNIQSILAGVSNSGSSSGSSGSSIGTDLSSLLSSLG